jgi:glucose-6-phosphate isomerase
MSATYAPAAHLIDRLLRDRLVSRIWSREPSAWGAADGSPDAASIRTRLGWLDVGETMSAELPRVKRFADEVAAEKIEAVYLLGMGGSSLCAEVLRSVYGAAAGYPDVHVLDTTDERTIAAAAGRISNEPERSLFLVASKSGGTVEVASLERFFWALVARMRGAETGRAFAAITDPGTALQRLAESKGYREIFLNPDDIGGRFSALSLFGLVPCSLIGADARTLLSSGATMAEGCRQENHANAGLELGAFIGAAALNGRDKLTLALAPSLASLGLWIEQLVAESTGKRGRGALPVVDEPLGSAAEYGGDRAFVSIATERDEPDLAMLRAIEDAGHPVLRLRTRIDGLGAEMFRWEFATAVAGAALGINPFDEPNVAEAKEKTRALLDTYLATGTLPEPAPVASADRVSAFSPTFSGASPAAVLRAALGSLKPGDYVAFLSYLPATSDVTERIFAFRRAIRSRFRVASTIGVGPRYLHSTGQYHKGGPRTIVAVMITGDDGIETPIPDAGYSFSVLKRAQALGDAETLAAHGRRVVRIHVHGGGEAEALGRLFTDASD